MAPGSRIFSRRTRADPGDSLSARTAGSATLLHDFQVAAGLVDLQLPLSERLPELIPGDFLDPFVAAFREPNSSRTLDAARSETLLLRLIDRTFDAYWLHDHRIP